MDINLILSLIPLYFKYGAVIEQLWKLATSNEDFITKVEQLLPSVANVAMQIAQQFFPNEAGTVNKIATTALVFNRTLVIYAQRVCNAASTAGLISLDAPLEVDGMYGPKTKAAVKKLQGYLGVTVDGIFGKITEAAVAKQAKLAVPS